MKKRGKIIRTLTDYPNLTPQQIAKRVGCTVSYVRMVEKDWLKEKAEAARQTEMFEDTEHVSVSPSDIIDAVQKPYIPDLYHDLAAVLEAAYNQAAYGKGAERHATDNLWTEQPIFTVAQQVGDGFNAGQVIKKTQEAQQMAARGEYSKAQHEILGAIVYAASLHVLWGKVR